MNVFRHLEEMLAGLVEGTFGRVFRSEVQPIQIAHKLAREMLEHRTVSVSRVYVPNEYVVYLSPEDRARYAEVEDEVIDELGAYLLEQARAEQVTLASRPLISFETDADLSLGEFGIQARLVRTGEAAADGDDDLQQGEHGHTMIYSTSERLRAPLSTGRSTRSPRALLIVDGRRMLVPPRGGVIGRSRECDVVIDDGNVSRRHAELSVDGEGWSITDLASTNGVRVNGRRIDHREPLAPGDRIELGATTLQFEER
jgi:hypothetical protein